MSGRSPPGLGGSERLEFFLGRSWGASRGRKGRAKILSLWLRCQADLWDLARGTYSCRAEGKKPPVGAPQRAGSSSSLEPPCLVRGASCSKARTGRSPLPRVQGAGAGGPRPAGVARQMRRLAFQLPPSAAVSAALRRFADAFAPGAPAPSSTPPVAAAAGPGVRVAGRRRGGQDQPGAQL